MILDRYVVHRRRGGIMDFDPVSDHVADFRTRAVGGLDDLQARGFEHRDVHHQRRQVVDRNVFAEQIESAGRGQRLIVQRMHAEREEPGLRRMQTELDHPRQKPWRGDSHKIICRRTCGSYFVRSQSESEVSLSIGSKRIVIFRVGRKAGALGQVQKVVGLIEKNFDACAGNRRGAAGPAGEHQTVRIDDYRRVTALDRRRVISGYAGVVYQSGSRGDRADKPSPNRDAMDLAGIYPLNPNLDDIVLNRAFVAIERIRQAAIVQLQRAGDTLDSDWKFVPDHHVARSRVAAVPESDRVRELAAGARDQLAQSVGQLAGRQIRIARISEARTLAYDVDDRARVLAVAMDRE